MQRDINEMHGKRRIRAPGAVWEAREVEEQAGEAGHECDHEQDQIYVESKGSADCMREPCEHILELARIAKEMGISIWSEHGEQPAGWVNIFCEKCKGTCETAVLKIA